MGFQYWTSRLLLFIGAFKVLQALYSFFHFMTFHFVTPTRPLAAYKSSTKPSWAVVTGSTAGIGLGIAKALLDEGFNLIILGPIENQVFPVVESLCHEYPDRDIRAVVFHVQQTSVVDCMSDFEAEKLRISILVNNVGGNPRWGLPLLRFWSYSPDEIDEFIKVNAEFMAGFTNEMIPWLQQKSAPGDRSLIINIGSSNWVGMPYSVAYSATKAFVRSFSIGLARELQDDASTKHIDSLCVMPGDVWTYSNCAGVVPGSPNADNFGRMVVDHVDGAINRGWRWMSPYWRHALEIYVFETLPELLATRVLKDRMKKKAAAWNEYSEDGGRTYFDDYPRSCGNGQRFIRKRYESLRSQDSIREG